MILGRVEIQKNIIHPNSYHNPKVSFLIDKMEDLMQVTSKIVFNSKTFLL